MENLSLPLVLREGFFDKATLHESLRYSIGLVLSTRIGSIPFEPEFGCGIWDKEYADLMTTNKADVRASLRNALDMSEKRIYNMSVSFSSVEGTASHPLGLAVKVTGNYRDDSGEQKFEETFVVG